MTIDLYYMALSPPCRSIIMLAKTIGIELNLKKVDLFAGEHMKPEFLKVSEVSALWHLQLSSSDCDKKWEITLVL